MGTSQKMFLLNTHLGLVYFGSFSMFLYRKMVFLCGVLWVFLCAYFHPLFRFIIKYVFRFHVVKSNSSVQENIKVESNICIDRKHEQEFESKPDKIEIDESKSNESSKEDSSSCFLKFKFPTFDEFIKSVQGNGDSPDADLLHWTSISKYEFMSTTKNYTGFMENNESFSCSIDDLKILNDGFLLGNDFIDQRSEIQAIIEGFQYDSTKSICKKSDHLKNDQIVRSEGEIQNGDFTADSDSYLVASSHGVQVINHLIDSNRDEFLSDQDFGAEFDSDAIMYNDEETIESTQQPKTIYTNEDTKMMEEIRSLETELAQKLNSCFLSEQDFGEQKDVKIHKEEFVVAKGNSKTLSNRDNDELNGLETLWEHQDLIEQLKIELKKVRATGLPTILEDSESPKVADDFTPWKIEEKFQHGDTIDELHKFYKSYREKMRKFDIFNYQKMYALGFLQAKDPLQLVSTLTSKSKNPPTKSIFLEKFIVWKPNKKSETDPTAKFIKELHSDLEMVYVGQMCLSWEFLYWQYEKAIELWESDPRRMHTYNQVSSEFQQFQILVQRFIEDEPFQGPRIQNYVKNRCVLRNLLQVPVIRADRTKRKNKGRRREESDITSDKIVEIMEDSIRVFWQYVRADKHEVNTFLKHRKDHQNEVQDPADYELLSEVRTTLQKKEKRLNDILRAGNCVLRIFQKNRSEESSDQVLYFFSQVDMKLVARVLNMSRITTEQLVWCHSKLSRINFVNRRIHVDSSFLLFPC